MLSDPFTIQPLTEFIFAPRCMISGGFAFKSWRKLAQTKSRLPASPADGPG